MVLSLWRPPLPSPKEIVEKHDKLRNVAREIEAIRNTEVFQRMVDMNSDEATTVIDSFAFGEPPQEPMVALMWFMNLRLRAQACLKLRDTLDNIEKQNNLGITALLSERKSAPADNEESDLDAGTHI